MTLFDTNVILEILENRRNYEAAVTAFANHQESTVTALTVSTVFYIAEKDKLDLNKVEQIIQSLGYIDLLAADVDWALRHYAGKDFEDALQVAAARREKCSAFVTLDKELATKYSKFLNIELIG